MSSTKDLINAISTGDAIGIESTFNTAMAEKIAVQLDVMRQNVAQSMFKTADAVSVETPAAE
jgi:hypothetical protein